MKNKITTISLILIFLLGQYACSPSQTESEKEEIAKKSFVEKQVVEVTSCLVERGVFARELVSNGTLSAKQKAEVPFSVQEQIINVNVHEGQAVSAGKILAKVDDAAYVKAKNDAQDAYFKTLIELEDNTLSRGYSIKDTANMPKAVLDMCKIRSGYNTALSALEEAKRNLNQTQLVAPINGVVANLQAQTNNPSSQCDYCCQILDNSTMRVEFHVLEGELTMVQKGQAVDALPYALPGVSAKGSIVSINPTVEDGLVKVCAEIPNTNGVLIDGMSVKILLKNSVANCIIVPKSAILYRQNRKVVFVNKNNIAHWVYVEVGLENSTHVTISDESLKPGEEVIISNNLNLAHESPIKVVTTQ